ncbi:MAG: amidohydrolase family protein [Verrucomicrobiota bacterium]
MANTRIFSRREFLAGAGVLLAGITLDLPAADPADRIPEAIIDIHQHTNYGGRADDQLFAHQRAMGVTATILLPAGRPTLSASTHDGASNGLQANCTGNEACQKFAHRHPGEFSFGANEVPDLPDAAPEIEKYLRLGAVLIGESKFGVECDSPEMQKIYALAQQHGVPVLMHWQFKMYNYGFERFYKMLEKFPKVNFIGHAQTWWASIDKDYKDHLEGDGLFPKQKVVAGGLTDRYLSDYPNMFGDLSAGSGLNAFLRDENHMRNFLERHQDKLMFGSDCLDTIGRGLGCQGAQTITAVRRVAPSKKIERKLLYENAKKLFRL